MQAIVEHIKALGEAGDYYITVAHTGITNEVKEVFAKVKEQFGEAEHDEGNTLSQLKDLTP